ncbi:Usherin [Mizuhopecten yessoensis]|uniref:Usherin n=1 Tax=Mizuhopecten yessoensis TaxID=6573 RepID=A0A210PSR6_MIZYE|nr:Usherin [Mizuhopecten yessoensis]
MKMTCNWCKEDYFSLLISTDKKSHGALEMLVDDLHADKEATIGTFLSHSGAEDFLWGLVRLLGCDNPRVAGNSAYIIGTLAESDLGCNRILGLAKAKHGESRKILPDLTRMLAFDDAESVMNAAGTMGTLAESYEGREWMLSEPCLGQTLDHVTALLSAENLWTASNAALVLARLSISENGCLKVLGHDNSQHILSRLVQSLGVDEAGRGMNAAFAIGRLCDIEAGRKRLLQLTESERMLSALAKMLSCDDTGSSKNACFALSCLATNVEGHTRLLNNLHSDDILRTLANLLTAEDTETGWFAAMTLRTLASQPRGCLRLRDHSQVIPALKSVVSRDNANTDLKEESSITLEILKKLSKPNPPQLQIINNGTTVKASWDPISTKSGFQVRYQLFDTTKCIFTGKELEFEISGLQPCTQYSYKLRAYTEGDESPFSDFAVIVTEESVPSAPMNLRVLGCTITQLKIGWDPPEHLNGVLKGYTVYQGDRVIENTTELVCIISGLQANTSYDIEVCAATSKGKGEKAYMVGTTSELGAHAPSKPHVQVIGRNEIHITWDPPEVPLGRITRYDVIMNSQCIYSGTDLSFTARRLTPDTEYAITVTALTNEGKFISKVTKKRTSKDEYDSNRPPLYQTPQARRESTVLEEKTPVVVQPRKKKAVTGSEVKSRALSAKRSSTPGKERTKTPADLRDPHTRPSSDSSALLKMSQRKSSSSVSSVAIQSMGTKLTETESDHDKESQRETSSPQKTVPQEVPRKEVVHRTRSQNNPVQVKEAFQSKPLPPKAERSQNIGKMFPVTMSYVSIQGNQKSSGDEPGSIAPEPQQQTKKAFVRSGTFVESNNVPAIHPGLKMERSRTIMNSNRRVDFRHRGVKITIDPSIYTNHTPNTQNSRGPPDLSPNAVSIDRHISKRNSNLSSAGTVRAIVNDLNSVRPPSNKSQISSNNDLNNYRPPNKTLCDTHGDVKSMKNSVTFAHTESNRPPTKSAVSKGNHEPRIASGERPVTYPDRKNRFRENALPKPEPPSQQYLEGTQSSSPWSSRSMTSPRNSQDLGRSKYDNAEVDALTKRLIEQGSVKDSQCTYLSPTGHPSDSSYFLDMQQVFVQRANSYISSHSQNYEESNGDRKGGVTLPSLPKPRNTRPHVSKQRMSDRAYRSGDSSLSGNPINLGTDLLDNKSPMVQWNTKFIPMQLRTQPSNLAPTQLQRVNTTLLGDPKGIQFKRIEALTRSQTLVDMRQPLGVSPGSNAHSLTLGEQAEMYPISTVPTHRSSARDRFVFVQELYLIGTRECAVCICKGASYFERCFICIITILLAIPF